MVKMLMKSLISKMLNSVEYTVHSNTSTLFSESYKYADGRLVINMSEQITTAITAQSGGIYFAQPTLADFPIEFISEPVVSLSSVFNGGSSGNAWVWGRSRPSTKNPGNIYLGRGSSANSQTYRVTVHAEGRWKNSGGVVSRLLKTLQSLTLREVIVW